MGYQLNEEGKELVRLARSFAEKELAPVVAECDRKGELPMDVYAKALEIGFHIMEIPKEYGGLGLPVEGHLWQPDRNWGYIGFQTPEEVIAKYEEFAAMLADTVDEGVSAAVYTQTTDVEIEVNGLMTYDRIPKLDTARLRKANQAVIERLK